MYKIMTPGPTQVAEDVRMARSRECTNPDLDESFVEFYKETCEKISQLLHTKNETLILGGEGILGLEAACASLTEPGDKVLGPDNGIFGAGFAAVTLCYTAERITWPRAAPSSRRWMRASRAVRSPDRDSSHSRSRHSSASVRRLEL